MPAANHNRYYTSVSKYTYFQRKGNESSATHAIPTVSSSKCGKNHAVEEGEHIRKAVITSIYTAAAAYSRSIFLPFHFLLPEARFSPFLRMHRAVDRGGGFYLLSYTRWRYPRARHICVDVVFSSTVRNALVSLTNRLMSESVTITAGDLLAPLPVSWGWSGLPPWKRI